MSTRGNVWPRCRPEASGAATWCGCCARSRPREHCPSAFASTTAPSSPLKALDHWAYWNGVALDFSRPAKPVDNTFIEAFNGTLRRECLSLHWFLGLEDLERTLEKWRDDYNHRRRHSSLADVPPAEFRTGLCCASDRSQLDFSPA